MEQPQHSAHSHTDTEKHERTKPTLKQRWASFKHWQQQPYIVAPMSADSHDCSTCGTPFVGNYCPRCGQSAQVNNRMTLWKTVLLFIDVWGMGNRSMFRTLRDLLARPGYLIRDYIEGRHSAYFPPFKLLFLLTTLSLLIGHGLNLRQQDYHKADEFHTSVTDEAEDRQEALIFESFTRTINTTVKFQQSYPALFQILFMLYTSIFYYVFFRKSQSLGRLKFHEFFIGMVYITDMTTIYSILLMFIGVPSSALWLTSVLYVIPLKQLSGYGWSKTAGRYIASVCAALLTFMVLLLAYFLVLFTIYAL